MEVGIEILVSPKEVRRRSSIGEVYTRTRSEKSLKNGCLFTSHGIQPLFYWLIRVGILELDELGRIGHCRKIFSPLLSDVPV